MEKQKIFWVVLSVSVFVVIVLVVGVYLLRQKPPTVATPPGAVNPISGPGTQIYEYSQEKPPAQTGAGTQQPGGQQTMHFYIGEGAENPSAQPPSGAQTQAGQNPPAGGQPTVTPPTVQAQKPPAKAHPAAVAEAPRKAFPTTRPGVRQKPHRTVDYWIQTGAYKSQSKADELIATLADKGLSGKVFSYDTSAGTFYRVRIGPYANQGEAGKFLSIVKQIQGLESSYISQVGGIRNVN